MRVKKKKTGSGRVFQIGITVHINTNVVAAHGKTFSPLLAIKNFARKEGECWIYMFDLEQT